ncbi:MAG: DUF2975 domain-containing protein [Bacteroidota bacterium]
MKTRTEEILTVMRVLTWVAYIGLCINAGSVLLAYGLSCFIPEAAKNIYKGLDMYNLRQFGFMHYSLSVALMAAVPILQAQMCMLLIKVLSKLNMANPFTKYVASKIVSISYILVGTWVVAVLAQAHDNWLQNELATIRINEVEGLPLFMAGLVFIIAQVFKRGVEIQAENDLTI